MSEIVYTVLGVFIGGVCTYEYGMWRTKRYVKKLVKTELPKIFPFTSALPPTWGLKPPRKSEDYE